MPQNDFAKLAVGLGNTGGQSPFLNVKVTCLLFSSLTLILLLLIQSLRFKWLFSSTDAMMGLLSELRIAVSSAKVDVKTLTLGGKSAVKIR